MTELQVKVIRETPPQDDRTLIAWIEAQMQAGRGWLLAHADDGVIWGRSDSTGKLITSHDLAPHISPALRLITLQQAFVFGDNGEARLWRDEMGWEARLLEELAEADRLDEDQVLWGTAVIQEYPSEGFTHVREKRQQGLDHVAPVIVNAQELEQRRLKLRIRHVISYDDETGEAHISLSRLVKVFVSQEERQP